MFNLKTFPYLVTRNKFTIDLVDLASLRTETLYSAQNTTGTLSKLAIKTTDDTLDIYFTALDQQQKSSLKSLSIPISLL